MLNKGSHIRKNEHQVRDTIFGILGLIGGLLARFFKFVGRKTKIFVDKVLSWANGKWGFPKGSIIVISAAVLILAGLITGTIFAVDAYNKEMDRLHQLQLEEDERRRLAEEEEARLRAEQEAREKLHKEYVAVMNLAQMGLPYKRLNVPIIFQYPEFPSACECMALTNMMNYYGFNLSKSTLVEEYLIYDDNDWVNYYVGSPYSADNGGIMMCPAIERLYNRYVYSHPSQLKAYDVTGRNFEDLFAYIERGHPVQIWSSLNMGSLGKATSTMNGYSVYWYTHSVLLTGFDRASGIVYVADSINGDCYYTIDRVKEIFLKQNSQAFVLISQEELDKWIEGIDWSYDDTIPKETEDEDSEDGDESQD